MELHRRWRTVAAAVLGALALLVLPGVAQAHHVDVAESYAKCEYVNGKSVLTVGVRFKGFNATYRPINGKIYVDGQEVKAYTDYRFDTTDHTLVYTRDVTAGQHTVKAVFTWKNQGSQNGTVEKTVTCGAPAMTIDKAGPATAYGNDTVKYTIKIKNTGNVVIDDVVVTDPKCTAPPVKLTQNANQFDPGDEWLYECVAKIPAAATGNYVNVAEVCGTYTPPGKPEVSLCKEDPHTTRILTPAIEIVKTGVAFAYAGDTVQYGFAVTNTGNVKLTLEPIADPKCLAAPARAVGETDTSFDPGDTWNFTCQSTVPADAAAGQVITNTASVCGEGMPSSQGTKPEVCDSDSHEFPVRDIAIDVEKTAAAPVVDRGAAAVFTITVTNTGPTALVNVVTGDDLCEETRTGDNAADTVLDPGETWTYTCSVATSAETVSPLVNTVTATGTNEDGKTATDTDDASVELVAPEGPPPTTTTPQGTPPGTVTPDSGGGAVLPEEIVSGRAALRGPSGCVRRAFTARVNGREISSVTFSVDGRVVKRFSADRSAYAIKVSPSKYGFGRHRIVARVTFSAESGTRARTMRLTFRRCAQGAVAPRFTG